MMRVLARRAAPLMCCAALVSLSACGSGDKKPPAAKTPQVGYVVVAASSVPMTTELGARTAAYQTSEVRPQVTGIIRKRFFTEGSTVQKGQPLYQIDPSLYQASAAEAKANLANAQATAAAARIKADRYKPLADMQAVAKQDYTDAAAAAGEAAAAVKQQQALLQTANINLKFTTVPAPITGKIGRSLFTEGALVTSSQTDPLTTIQRLDPIYVDIQQSSAAELALRRSLGKDGVVPAAAQVHLKLDDGSDYGLTGTVEFSEAMVDENTGTVTLRARFPNPQGLLLPGMFVRAEFAQSVNTRAILVPQAGVAHDPKGNATVLVLGPGNKVVQKTVKADSTQGAYWVVTSGLNPGDKVITEGTANAKPGAVVQPVVAGSPEKIVAPQGKAAKPQQSGS
ncbi:efflux RND transporter periplasmic adaptor subunit [Sphingomonas koreensis]|nr:efflux RND transporter periplasmic adaptor subunit [Sphingomonas koreensis]TPG43466.1 efflux RND transporter periplasmic adaptor subunit [Sphingomonas koreensis]